MTQLKPPTTYIQQVQKLRSRGCIISDEPFCIKVLSQINYYRLTAYFLPFKKPDSNYLPGTDFNTVYQIYEFDRNMRNLLFATIEEVEIYLRAEFAYYHAHNYGATGYMNSANYNSRKHNHNSFTEKIKTEISQNKKVLFVEHHQKNYGGQFPVWVITELFTFGMLSYFFGDMLTSDQKNLARKMYGTIPKNLVSWLRCCTDLRNICAHYGRLYFRIFTAIPAFVPGLSSNSARRLFGAILALKELYPDKGKWNSGTHSDLVNLINSYSGVVNLNHIGFPVDWESVLKK
jgi:abortive infection bacteriophage resistance protein